MKTVGSLPYATPATDSPKYGSLPGTAGAYFSTPDSAAASITGDIDIKVQLALVDWTPSAINCVIAKWSSAPNLSYLVSIDTTGKIQFASSANGTAVAINALSTAAVGWADGAVGWIRATLDVDNGASGYDLKFYTSQNGFSWTQLGTTITGGSTTSIADGNATLAVGTQSNGTTQPTTGNVYCALIYSAINAAVPVVNYCAGDYISGTTWVAQVTGETWTINGTASVVVPAAQPAGAMKVIGTTVAATLPAGTVYYNGLAYHPDGSLYVVFG